MYCVVQILDAKRYAVVPVNWVKGLKTGKIRNSVPTEKKYDVFLSNDKRERPHFGEINRETPATFSSRGTYKAKIHSFKATESAALAVCNGLNGRRVVKVEKELACKQRAIATVMGDFRNYKTIIDLTQANYSVKMTYMPPKPQVVVIDGELNQRERTLQSDSLAGRQYEFWSELDRFRHYNLGGVTVRLKARHVELLLKYNEIAKYRTELYDRIFLKILFEDCFEEEIQELKGILNRDNLPLDKMDFIKGIFERRIAAGGTRKLTWKESISDALVSVKIDFDKNHHRQ